MKGMLFFEGRAKVFGAKLIRFGQIWLDLGKFWAKMRRNLGKSD